MNIDRLMPTVMREGWQRLLALFVVLLTTASAAGPADDPEDGFPRVTGPCRLAFPADHGPHPDYRIEWWYYTGNVADAHDRRFGFQLTFFRARLKPPAHRREWPRPASPWRTDQVYLAHAAVTDMASGRHLQAEKVARPVLEMAGARTSDTGLTIHIHSWQAIITPRGHRLQADADNFAISLDLDAVKPPVSHGEDGYSRKGQAPERASCYYSFTRLQAAGSLTVDGIRHSVKGSAWMDHEFSSSPLQPDISGWDWFSLQLSDRTEIMIYLLRHPTGRFNAASAGTFVDASGLKQPLTLADIRIRTLAYWTSPHTGARYPAAWEIAVDSLHLALTVKANPADQEMRTPRSTGVVYWEGSVEAHGTRADRSVDAVGYVELTGYAKPFDAPM